LLVAVGDLDIAGSLCRLSLGAIESSMLGADG